MRANIHARMLCALQLQGDLIKPTTVSMLNIVAALLKALSCQDSPLSPHGDLNNLGSFHFCTSYTRLLYSLDIP